MPLCRIFTSSAEAVRNFLSYLQPPPPKKKTNNMVRPLVKLVGCFCLVGVVGQESLVLIRACFTPVSNYILQGKEEVYVV